MPYDKGDYYADGHVICASCNTKSKLNPWLDLKCPCGRTLSGWNRESEPELPRVEIT